jgi:hypothetical protein
MKKLSMIVVALLVAGVISSWALPATEDDSFVFGPIPVTMTGKLISSVKANTGTVNAESINGTNVEFAIAQFVAGVSTDTFYVIGNGLSTVTTNQAGHTNVFLTGTVIWEGDDAVETKSNKTSSTTLIAMGQVQQVIGVDSSVAVSNSVSATGENVITNSVLLVTLSSSEKVSKGTTNTTGSATFTGIWNETDGTAVSGSMKAAK